MALSFQTLSAEAASLTEQADALNAVATSMCPEESHSWAASFRERSVCPWCRVSNFGQQFRQYNQNLKQPNRVSSRYRQTKGLAGKSSVSSLSSLSYLQWLQLSSGTQSADANGTRWPALFGAGLNHSQLCIVPIIVPQGQSQMRRRRPSAQTFRFRT